jgi:hypothetical protein
MWRDMTIDHPKLEIPGLTCLGRESNPGLRNKELFEQRINTYSEHLRMSPRQDHT